MKRRETAEKECPNCHKEFKIAANEKFSDFNAKKFCTQFCAKSFNNKQRSKEVYKKQAQTLSSYYKELRDTQQSRKNYETENFTEKLIGTYTKIKFCKECTKVFLPTTRLRSTKYCSQECSNTHFKKAMKEMFKRNPHIAKNRSRGRESFLERSFREWLEVNNIPFKQEEAFIMEGRAFFADFFFEEKNLIIELDGSQHLQTKEKDAVRDLLFLQRGIRTIRISHKEFISKEKLPLVKMEIGLEANFGLEPKTGPYEDPEIPISPIRT